MFDCRVWFLSCLSFVSLSCLSVLLASQTQTSLARDCVVWPTCITVPAAHGLSLNLSYVGSFSLDALAMALHCVWSTDSFPAAVLKVFFVCLFLRLTYVD